MGDFRKKYKPQTHLRKEILPSPSKIQTELSTTNFRLRSYYSDPRFNVARPLKPIVPDTEFLGERGFIFLTEGRTLWKIGPCFCVQVLGREPIKDRK